MKAKTCLVLTIIVAALGLTVFHGSRIRPEVSRTGAAVAAELSKPGTSPHASGAKARPPIASPQRALAAGTGGFDWAAITAFNDWAQRWQGASPDQREAMKAEGLQLAGARRPEFKKLIAADPERALEQAVRPVIRQTLPPEIVQQLEKPVSARGDFKVYLGRPADGMEMDASKLVLRYFETGTGDSYLAHVFGNVETVMTRKDVPVRGVAVDRELAVADGAVRVLEPGEIIPAGAAVDETCPVSGNTTVVETAAAEPITDETPTIELEGRLIRLCDGSHVRVLDEQYRLTANISAHGGPGGAHPIKDSFPGTSSESIGNFKALYIRACYPDRLVAPNTEESAYDDMKNFARFYMESSYGRLSVSTAVTPLLVLPHTREWYEEKDAEVDGLGLVHSDSRRAARLLGFDSGQFNVTIVRINGGPRLNGVSWGGGDSVWVSWDGMDVINHECGHSIGRPHANFWNTGGQSAIGPGANQEYGNSFDVMGGGGGFSGHYNTISKRSLGWLPVQNTHNPIASGVYRIFAYDQPMLEEGKRYGLRVPKDRTRGYNLEFHREYGVEHTSRVELTNSAVVMWSGFGGAGHLIDTTPGTPSGKDDAGIELGRTFSDPAAGVHFTVVSKNATAPESLDIAVTMGNALNNLPPTLSLAASGTTVGVNGSLTFTATASDPNGDALAYHWDCGDGYASVNTPVLTRSFGAVRQLTIHCTVSDMKGGTARRHVVVTVGSPGRQVVTGRVTAAGQPVPHVLINGTVSTTTRYAYTDSDGYYAISDLPTGAATVTPLLYGNSFTPNPGNLTIVAGANTLNFTATPLAQVSIAATANAAEPSASGAFTFTRSGGTATALDVRVMAAAGTAARGTDYNLSPDYADNGNYRVFTIPAGSVSLEVSAVPINDAGAEGPETITLQLAEGTNYIPGLAGSATLTLADDDTTLPQVSLASEDTEGSEAPGNIASFIVTRTGPATNNLSVALTYGGTAMRGVDYPALPLAVTIPAGQSSATVLLAPINDAAVEGSETVSIGLASGANYVRDGIATNVDLLLLDDDISSVTITAIDASASEAARDPGVFLVTRTGPTAAPLKVYYGIAGTASHGTDYIALPAEVTIPAGAASAPVFITPYDDSHGEGVETVTLQLTVFNGAYLVGSPAAATVNLGDNNDAGLLTVDSVSSTAGEPSDAGRFRFNLRGTRATATTVRYTVSGTATAGADYQALPSVVVLPATVNGMSEVEIDVTPIDDAVKEDVETVILTLTPDPAYVVFNSEAATVLLRDNDQPLVSVSKAEDIPAEGINNDAAFYIGRTDATLTPLTNGALVVTYTLSGTALNGVDFTALSGIATILDGAPGVDLALDPVDDALLEGTESVTLTIEPSASYGLGVPSDTMRIADNDAHPISVSFQSATGTTSENLDPTNGEYRLVPVALSAASTNTVTVEVFMAAGCTAWGEGIDWNLADETNGFVRTGLLTFPPGVTSQNARIRIVPDSLIEGTETAVLVVTNAWNARIGTARVTHTLTILDATNAYPPVRVMFLNAASSVGEADGGDPLLIVGLDRVAPVTVSVNYAVSGGTATEGSDFTLASGTVNFEPGEISKSITLAVLNDTAVEPSETIVITLSSPTGADLGPTNAHTVTILDNDTGTPAVTIAGSDTTATEGGDTATFTVTRLSGGAAGALTVNYVTGGSATEGSDHVALPGSVVIPVGQASAPIVLSTLNDASIEPTETVTITIIPDAAYALGPVITASVSILDDETLTQPPTAFSQSVSVPRNQPSAITLTASDPNGDPLAYQVVSSPTQGALTGAAPNLTYTPPNNYVGPASFTFRATDGMNTSAVATVSLTVFNPTLVASNSAWRYNDAGVDLGSAWRSNSYVETTWSNGVARLGFGDPAATVIRGQPVITYYFRQSFTPPAGVTFTSLTARVQRDDGLVVYVNGAEAFRDNMPSGGITYSTRPSASVNAPNETAWFTFAVNPALLQPGTNVIAAELHQIDGTSSDAGFALELSGAGVPSTGLPSTVTITATDASATEPDDAAAFTVTRLGSGTTADLIVAYSVSGTATPGADYISPSGIVTIPAGQASAAIPIIPLDDYEVEAVKTVVLTLAAGPGYNLDTNINATVTLADDDASLQPPTANPQSVSIRLNTPTAITLTATDLENDPLIYQVVTPPTRGMLSGTPPNITYTPNTGYLGGDSFTFRASDGGPWSAPATVTLTVYDPAIFIPSNSVWRFNDLGTDLGTAWRATNYNDAGWSNGVARLGFSPSAEDGEATTLRGQPVYTYYFRQAFVVTADYTVTNGTVSVSRDDGVVVYLNGTEVARDNMPAGTILYSTRAGGNTGDEQAFYNFPVSAALFRPGTNVLAAEVHQVNSTSSDIGFNLQLRGDGYFTVITAPTLALDRPTASTVRITFPSANGLRWAVDGSIDLQTWQGLATNTVAGGMFQFTTGSLSPAYRFFRARHVP